LLLVSHFRQFTLRSRQASYKGTLDRGIRTSSQRKDVRACREIPLARTVASMSAADAATGFLWGVVAVSSR
jgi:hypothetical protein